MFKEYISSCIDRMCNVIGSRPAGSKANHLAAEFMYQELKAAGLDVTYQKYECPDWKLSHAALSVSGRSISLITNTFSPSCKIEAELIAAGTLSELISLDITGKILIIHSELTTSYYFPKNFDFFRDEDMDRIISLIEEGNPAAVITVSHVDHHIQPLIEDSDFKIPSVTVSASNGLFLLQNLGGNAQLEIVSILNDSWGANVIGKRKGNRNSINSSKSTKVSNDISSCNKRIVVCAHYDTKYGTSGAIDNAAGCAALLTLAKILKNDIIESDMEFIAFGGEDSWYPGDAQYMKNFDDCGDNVLSAINIDGIGIKDYSDGIAFLGCPDVMIKKVLGLAPEQGNIKPIEPFYAGDHSFFWARNIPTMTFCSVGYFDSYYKVCHTADDKPELLSCSSIEETAQFIRKIIFLLEGRKD